MYSEYAKDNETGTALGSEVESFLLFELFRPKSSKVSEKKNLMTNVVHWREARVKGFLTALDHVHAIIASTCTREFLLL